MDLQYRELLRNYAAGDIESGHKATIHAFRSGYSLVRMRDNGLPWELVKDYIHLLNPVILSPEETSDYKGMLLHDTNMHYGFIARQPFFVKGSSRDDWHPNWPKDVLKMGIYFYHHDGRWAGQEWEAPEAKIGFWGLDDTGMELMVKDVPQTTDLQPLDVIEAVLRRLPDPVTKQWLTHKGFEFA